MRLKRVRIFGFKTFADRTEVNLDGGIVAVVGPNGCGKSNLVDAILWALGESNSRHLRAAASQDVIFSGSARRKPIGFAEVSLLFENEDGSLPIDTSEVSIGRKLNRAGESEYFINRRSCRQRDIHELLADSGLGRAGYSIVGQKEIDQALAASAEDRRAWVDEAAGVQRYRTRKIESVRRLASAREHLIRVDDIIRELDTQRLPLQEEAEVARKYKTASAALREVETGLLMRELAKACRDVAELESRLGESAGLVRKESERAEQLDTQLGNVRAEIAELEHKIEGIRARLQDAMTAMERADAGGRLGVERLRSLDQLEETLRTGDNELLLKTTEAELEACRQEQTREEQTLELARQEVGGYGAEALALSAKLRHAEAELASARQKQSLRMRQQAESEHRRGRRELAERERLGIDQSLPDLIKARDIAQSEVDEIAAQVTAAQARLAEIESNLARLRTEEDALGARSRLLLAEKAALDGRRRGIEATIHSHDGVAQGSRAVLEAADRGDLTGEYVPVGQAIHAGREHALAIETALGASINDLIVADDRDAKEAIRYLKQHRLGRATFQPIPLMRPVEASRDLKGLLVRPGVLGQASSLIECDPRYRPVIESLLARVLVVRDLDVALGLAKSDGWSRIVSLDGDLVHSSGAVSGGVNAKPHYGLVQRRADLDQIDKEIEAIARNLRKAEAEAVKAAESKEKLQASLIAAKSDSDRVRVDLIEAKDYLQTLNSEWHAAEKSREKLLKELADLAVEVAISDEVDIERLQNDRDSITNELAGRSADANLAKDRLREAESRLQQAKNRTSAVANRLEAARHTETQREAKLKNLEPERHRAHREIQRHLAEHKEAEAHRNTLDAELLEAQGVKDRLVHQSIEITEEAKAARANLAAMAEANHQSELGRARAESRRAGAAERLLEEYGITTEDALEQADSTEVPGDAQALVHRLRREIRAMGSVNIGAIEAFERLSLRHEELTAQRADILEGIEQVNASMQELDKLTRDKFLETFAKVEEAYSAIFQKLFEGGEGKIRLDNPGSILESGIEIEVTLPGKKRQKLELLSGGERALCATGFLFALLKVKPSPLVVLDEVDAPLDGRNVERFADLLLEFTDKTQFILITHNPTTIERAPVWLGVTMQEPGVSTLVPARLPTHAVVQPPLPATGRLAYGTS